MCLWNIRRVAKAASGKQVLSRRVVIAFMQRVHPHYSTQGVEEKFIRDRTGHRSNALFKDEKVNEMKCCMPGF